MAFTLSTIYKAVDKMSPVMKKMQAANNKFAARQDASMRRMGSAIGNVKNQLIGLAGGVSIAALLTVGASAVTKFDTSLKSLSSITGITGKAFDVFKAEILDVSNRTKMGAYDVAKAFELVGAAQPELLKDAKALSKVSEAAIVLSKASGDDLAQSAANVTGVLNQFGLGAESASRAINVLSAGSVVGAANITDVTEAMKNVGAVASSSNASVEETVSLIEVLGKFQIKGAEAGTKLRGVFLKLQNAGIGYASGQFNINDALSEANNRVNKLATAKQKDAMMTKIFGAENITAGKIILSNTKLFEEYTKGVTGTNFAFKQAQINSSSFSFIIKELKARFENIIIKGNESSKILQRFGKVIQFVTKHLDKILVAIGVGIGALIAYHTIMSSFRIAMLAYSSITKIATIAQWAFNAAQYANPIVWIIVAIVAAVAAIALLVWKWKEITAWFEKSSKTVKVLVSIFAALNFGLVWIVFIIRKIVDHWKGFVQVFREGGFIQGIKAIGKVIFSVLLKPIELALKLLGKIPGMKFAKKGAELISGFRAGLEAETLEKEKPVNTKKALNDKQTIKFEEIINQKSEIELTNKTDKNANVKSNPALVPILINTR